jgi:hypothetical protein
MEHGLLIILFDRDIIARSHGSLSAIPAGVVTGQNLETARPEPVGHIVERRGGGAGRRLGGLHALQSLERSRQPLARSCLDAHGLRLVIGKGLGADRIAVSGRSGSTENIAAGVSRGGHRAREDERGNSVDPATRLRRADDAAMADVMT